jgi:C4-dicarboxylate-binding protein DctP
MTGSYARRLFILIEFLLLPWEGAHAQQVTLKANLQFPVGHPVFGASLAQFKAEVEQRSRGAVSIAIFDKAQLFTDYQVVDAVASGAVDIGMTAAQQFSYKAPLVGILDQPFLFNFPALMNAAASPDSEIRQLIDEAILGDIGVRVLWWHPLGNNVFFANGGRDVVDPARLKGRRVASPGKLPGEVVAWCGGEPVAMSVEKFQGSFKDGTVDMAVVALLSLHVLGLANVADTVTYTSHSPVEFFLVINEKTWQSLSPAHRTIVTEAARKVERELTDRQTANEATDRAFAAGKGIAIHELNPDQVAEWRACSAGMLADYMDKHGQRAHRLMDAYGRLRTQPCCTNAPSTAAFTRR